MDDDLKRQLRIDPRDRLAQPGWVHPLASALTAAAILLAKPLGLLLVAPLVLVAGYLRYRFR